MAERAVDLQPLSEADFPLWRQRAIDAFAADLVRATGQDAGAAAERAEGLFAQLLPDGLDTEGARILVVLDGTGSAVGHLWFGPHPQRPDAAFAYDIEIAAEHRGRGLGTAAIHAAERLLAEAGVTEIGLSVFGFNEAAKRLYERLGYRVVSTQMSKSLR